ncbi:hypothetical protein [Pseudovibrio sp. SPO723]|uniref:hypothetical protein n=1 Tax=Nesiotobacter zosterae TaxID=392721 RepID=UPI0029C5D472|nr:hypothetical protein [Pseudovibrio sp. SPO723]MDX5592620.1 hypothetical protein [Pseudovibrio sp. SPO723]
MKLRHLIIMCLIASTAPATAEIFRPPPAKEGYSYPECYCTNRGQRIEIGEHTCLRIGKKQIWALCDMSLNSPILRHLHEGCPTALLNAPSDPVDRSAN